MPIQLVCGCGRPLRVPDEYVGRRVQCPGCGESYLVAAGQAATGGGGRRDRLPGKGRGVLLAMLLGLLVVGLGGAAVWWFWQRQSAGPTGEGDDLALIPADAQGFVTARLADVWKVPAVREGFANVRRANAGGLDPVEEMERLTGLRPEEVERVSSVAVDAGGRVGWAVVRTVQPYDRRKVLARLHDSREHVAEGRSYYAGMVKGGGTLAVHFVGSRVLVFGPEEGVKRCLAFAAGPAPEGPLRPLITQAGGSRAVVAGLASRPGQPLAGPLAEAQLASLFVDVGDQVSVDAKVQMKDEKAAQELINTIGLLAQSVSLLAMARGLPGGEQGNAWNKVREQLKNLKPEQEGNEVRLRAQTDPGTMVRAVSLVLSLVGVP
jgi:hypothetical protein